MDKQIAYKSAHVGHIAAGAGFILTLASLAAGISSLHALHIMAASFFIASFIEGIINIIGYERGI